MVHKFKRGDKVHIVGYCEDDENEPFLNSPPTAIANAIAEKQIFTIKRGTPDENNMVEITEKIDDHAEFYTKELEMASVTSWKARVTADEDET